MLNSKKKQAAKSSGGGGGGIPKIDRVVSDGDVVELGSSQARCIAIPGHTLDQIAFWFEKDKIVFTGDTLFSIGCGRIFEGNPKMMWESLCKLRELPPETQVYCGHEYTEKNIEFALTLEPKNKGLHDLQEHVKKIRKTNKPSVPSTLETEIKLNPFLRADDSSLKEAMGLKESDTVEVFAEVRKRKDRY